jgi:DNA-binding response OmpR family regulator
MIYPEIPTELTDQYGIALGLQNDQVATDIEVIASAVSDGRRLEIPLGELLRAINEQGIDDADSAKLLVFPLNDSTVSLPRQLQARKNESIEFASSAGTFNPANHDLSVNGKGIHLTKYEGLVMSFFAHNLDQKLARGYMTRKIWPGLYTRPGTRSPLDVHIARLRKKLDTAYPGMGHKRTGALRTYQNVGSVLLSVWPDEESPI